MLKIPVFEFKSNINDYNGSDARVAYIELISVFYNVEHIHFSEIQSSTFQIELRTRKLIRCTLKMWTHHFLVTSAYVKY
jgi:hypothetical protein